MDKEKDMERTGKEGDKEKWVRKEKEKGKWFGLRKGRKRSEIKRESG